MRIGMRAGIKLLLVGAATGLACAVLAWQPAAAGGKGNQQSRVGQLSVRPGSIANPITADNPLNICVSGLAEGNVAMVLVPYIGTPASHSESNYRRVVDSSGGFCFDTPPSWGKMGLQPGSYAVRLLWSNNESSKSHEGPTAPFEVTAF